MNYTKIRLRKLRESPGKPQSMWPSEGFKLAYLASAYLKSMTTTTRPRHTNVSNMANDVFQQALTEEKVADRNFTYHDPENEYNSVALTTYHPRH